MSAEVRSEADTTAAGAEVHTAVAASIFQAAAARFARGPRIPRATYRVQLNADFTFSQATALCDYLRDLGISDLYASPFFRSRPGSTHGYDLVDHNALSPAIGSRAELDALSEALRAHDLGLLLDFVPNHMGIGPDNVWWMDVLENGPSSLFSPFFDIDWQPIAGAPDRVLLPVLGDHYGTVLENGQLRVRYDSGGFFLDYFENTLPVNPRTYPMVLEPMLPELSALLGPEDDAVLELMSICTGLVHLPTRHETKRAKVIERRREKEILKRRLAALVGDRPDVQRALAASVARINGRAGQPSSFDALDRLLEEQAYRVSYWRVAAEEINYRRFFDINELAAINVEKPQVFAEVHRLLFELLDRGHITSLRIDHPDGLWDPPGYFRNLQRAFFLRACARHLAELASAQPDAPPFAALEPLLRESFDSLAAAEPRAPAARPLYIVGEKILSQGEQLPARWGVHGTTGYEFAVLVGAVFVDPAGERPVSEIYERFIGRRIALGDLIYQSKKLILQVALASELAVLAHALHRLSHRDRHSRDFTLGALTDVLGEVIACFPVYRTYVDEHTEALDPHDRSAAQRALRVARRKNPTMDKSIFAYLGSVFMLEGPRTAPDDVRKELRNLVMKVQQLTGPVMAKGVEDTAFYVYNRLACLNEVGGEPERFGRSVAELHRANTERQAGWPASLLAGSTHDTKRSEDVRARIGVLSELPTAWGETLGALAERCARFRTELEGGPAPDHNEQYLFYQTLVGTWPTASLQAAAPGDDPGAAPAPAYAERLVGYMR
ncbi:MAG: malto-oligosyltrehalose synthase [Polyangiaceae bacterium]